MQIKKLSKLIADIHELPFATGFPRTLLAALGTWVGSEIGVVMEQEPASGDVREIQRVGFPDVAMRDYEDYYAYRSVLLKESAKHNEVGRIFTDDMMPDYRKYTASEAYNDFFAPHHAHHLLQTHTERTGRWVTALTFRRPKEAGHYSPSDRERFQVLIPHLISAARHSRLLREERVIAQSLTAALDKLQAGVVLVDTQDRVVFANARAEGILRAGNVIAVKNRRLVASRHEDNKRLRQMLKGARNMLSTEASMPHDQLLIQTSDIRQPAIVSAMPLTPRTAEPFSNRPAVAVFIATPGQLKGAEDTLRTLYGLTASEARVAVGLYDGLTVAEVAQANATSRDAVRFHLKNTFQKLGVRRQSELIRLIAPAVMVRQTKSD